MASIGRERFKEAQRNSLAGQLPCSADLQHASAREDQYIYELPFSSGARFRVSQGYGGSYSHTERAHYSIDFSMPENTPVCAARGGVVYRVVDHFSEGGTHLSFKPKANAIYVLHADDTIATYAHLAKNGARVCSGQFVVTGQMIGLSGNTGWSGHPHLHFHVADAAFHERIPTLFNTAERGISGLKAGTWITRPADTAAKPAVLHDLKAQGQLERPDRDPYSFSSELLALKEELILDLSSAGYELGVDYSSVDILHDVHGLEVCGILNPLEAIQIIRLLIRLFPGWSPGWLHAPDAACQQGWVARIQRNRDMAQEYWDTD